MKTVKITVAMDVRGKKVMNRKNKEHFKTVKLFYVILCYRFMLLWNIQ